MKNSTFSIRKVFITIFLLVAVACSIIATFTINFAISTNAKKKLIQNSENISKSIAQMITINSIDEISSYRTENKAVRSKTINIDQLFYLQEDLKNIQDFSLANLFEISFIFSNIENEKINYYYVKNIDTRKLKKVSFSEKSVYSYFFGKTIESNFYKILSSNDTFDYYFPIISSNGITSAVGKISIQTPVMEESFLTSNIYYFLITFIFISSVFLISGVIFTNLISGKIKSITYYLNAVADGNFNLKPVKSSKILEFNSLNDGLFYLVKSINNTNQSNKIPSNIKNSITSDQLLKSMKIGILLVKSDLKILNTQTDTLEKLLNINSLAGENISDVLFPDKQSSESKENSKKLEDFLNFVFNLFVVDQFENCSQNAISQINFLSGPNSSTKFLNLAYFPIAKNDVIEAIAIQISEVDSNSKPEIQPFNENKKIEEMVLNIKTLLKEPFSNEAVRNCLSELIPLAKNAKEAIKKIDSADLNELFRNLHTIKGGVRSFKFDHLNFFTHELESIVSNMKRNNSKDSNNLNKLIIYIQHVYDGLNHLSEIWEIAQASNRSNQNINRTFPWNAFLENIEKSLISLAFDINKTIKIHIDFSHIPTGKDFSLIQKVIHHLARNSIDHGIETAQERLTAGKPKVGKIEIQLILLNKYWSLKLTDDGKGIDKGKVFELAKKNKIPIDKNMDEMGQLARIIFTPGFSSKTQVTDISGRGVGTDAVFHELKKVGGSFSIERTNLTGTTFSLSWQQLSDELEGDKNDTGVLIVDDDEDIVEILYGTIKPLDIPIYKANSVKEAKILLASHKIGVVITDLNMPEQSGYSLISDLAREYPELKIIVSSGKVGSEFTKEALNLQLEAFLPKPVDFEELFHIVKRALRRNRIEHCRQFPEKAG